MSEHHRDLCCGGEGDLSMTGINCANLEITPCVPVLGRPELGRDPAGGWRFPEKS